MEVRRQILQENIRWKALDKIYKIYMLLHRSDLNISEKIVKLFRIFRQNLAKFAHFRNMLIEICSESCHEQDSEHEPEP